MRFDSDLGFGVSEMKRRDSQLEYLEVLSKYLRNWKHVQHISIGNV